MPATRTPTDHSRRPRITPAAVDAFNNDEWLVLHRLLGLKPWEPSPLDVMSAEQDGWSSIDAERWAEIRELRRQLEEAAVDAN